MSDPDRLPATLSRSKAMAEQISAWLAGAIELHALVGASWLVGRKDVVLRMIYSANPISGSTNNDEEV
jgi:hypothetical protein